MCWKCLWIYRLDLILGLSVIDEDNANVLISIKVITQAGAEIDDPNTTVWGSFVADKD